MSESGKHVAVFGAGYVGLVTGACFAELGHEVVVRDVLPERIAALESGRVPLHEPELPELLERNSSLDDGYGETPLRIYPLAGKPALRLTFRTGANEYWGIQETQWADAPVLADKSITQRINGREYDLYYSGSNLHMVVLRDRGATYWVVNTLLNSLSNETMLAIARGLRPLPR